MSATFRHYLAGQVRLLPELLPMFAPTVNSYKRLVEGAWAPTRANWGVDNRTTAFRVIPAGAKSTRLETRVSGSDVNPYLALAAALGSGLYGIEHRLELPAGPVPATATPTRRPSSCPPTCTRPPPASRRRRRRARSSARPSSSTSRQDAPVGVAPVPDGRDILGAGTLLRDHLVSPCTLLNRSVPMSVVQFNFPTPIKYGPGAVPCSPRRCASSASPARSSSPTRGSWPAARDGPARALADAGLAVQVFGGIWGNPDRLAGRSGRRRLPGPWRRRHRGHRRRRGARRRQVRRRAGQPPRQAPGVRRLPAEAAPHRFSRCRPSSRCRPRRARAARSDAAPWSPTTSPTRRRSSFLQAAGQARLPRPRADAVAAVEGDGRDGHGRPHPLRRELPPPDVPSDVRRHRAGGAAPHRPLVPARRRLRQEVRDGRGGRHRRARRSRAPGGARRDALRRHDGRCRLSKGPGPGALLRALALDGGGPASRPRQRHHDCRRHALQQTGERGKMATMAATVGAKERRPTASSPGSTPSAARSASRARCAPWASPTRKSPPWSTTPWPTSATPSGRASP